MLIFMLPLIRRCLALDEISLMILQYVMLFPVAKSQDDPARSFLLLT